MAAISSTDRSEYEDGGGRGGGGKFRKKPLRRTQITPYDRPSTSLGNSNYNGWLYRKLLDPASKFITSGASRFFASIFQKRLPPPTNRPVTEAKEESTEKIYPTSYSQNITLENSPRLQQHNITEGEHPSTNNDKNGYYELEQILKQKTFTRSEIERLTSLLHSRTLDTENRCVTNSSLADQDREDIPDKISMQVNGIEIHKLHRTPLPSIFNSKVAEEDVASPSELAKSYMGSRPLKPSPSQLGLCSQASRERTHLLSNSPFTPKSASISRVPNFGVLPNEAIAPRSRGKSAIHSMTRTPYSRIHPASYKGSVTKFDSFGEPSPSSLSHFRVEGDRLSSSKQMALKRGSYVLANDIGSIGPIRRIRQKPNLLSSKSPLSGAVHVSKSQTQSGDKTTSILSQSNVMAQKILYQLDKLVPSKDKSSDMINGQASRSPENVKISPIASVPDSGGPSSQKQDKVEENGPTKITNRSERSALALDVIDTFASKKEYTSITKFGDGLPQKKQAFQMSAPEASLDLDNGGYSNGTANSLNGVRTNVDTSLMQRKSSFTEEVKVDRTPVSSEVEPLSNFVSNKNADPETFNGATQSESSMTIQPAVSFPRLNSELKQVHRNQTSNVPPMFSFRSNNVDNAPSTMIGGEFKGMKSGASLDPKPESSTSFLFAAAGDATLKVPESDNFDKETQKAEDIFRRSKAAFPSVASTLSFGSPINNLGINNGPSMPAFTSSISSSIECPDDAQVKKKKLEMPFGLLSSKPFDTTFSVSSVAASMASAQASASTGPANFTQSTPVHFGSSSPILELNGTTSVADGSSPFGSSTPANMFSSGQSSPTPTYSLFNSHVQPVKSSLLDSTPQSAASSSAFSFATQNNNTSVLAVSSPGISASSLFSFTQSSGNTFSTPSTPPQPLLNSVFTFGSPSSNSDGMMSVEDTMAEDTMQASTPPISKFGLQPNASPSAGANSSQFGDKPFLFGNQQNPFQSATSGGASSFQFLNQQKPPQTGTTSGANTFEFGNQHNPPQTATTGANLFQFGNQQSFPATSHANQSPFQAASQGGFNAGGSFSIGTGGGGDGDKSNRRIVKPRRNVRKR